MIFFCFKVCFKTLEKSLKICSGYIFFRFDFRSFPSLVQFHCYNRKANSIFEKRKRINHEKRDRLLVSKMEFNFQIFQRNIYFTY